MKVKTDKRDTIFSLLVRERACNCCEKCGKNGLHWAMQCSHIFSRRHKSTRWHADNAQCLCFTCHKWWHENPSESGVWIRKLLGDGFIEILKDRKNQIKNYTKADKVNILNHLRGEYAAMLRKRSEGECGRIEFESYD